MIRYREYTVAALHLRRQTILLKKINHSLIVIIVKSAVQKLRVRHHIGKQGVHIPRIRDVAPPFAGDVELFPKLFIFLEQNDLMSPLRRRNGSKHSRRPAADYDHLTHTVPHLLLFHTAS